MGNMIVSDNRIKSRRYNLRVDGNIVEEFLSPRMANILAAEYRAEGFAVDKIEVFTVTNGMEIVAENLDGWIIENPRKIERKQFITPAATDKKVEQDRVQNRAKNALIASKKNANTSYTRYKSYGRDRNSSLREMYLDNLRRNGFRVINLQTNQVWIGTQAEISKRIFEFVNTGGKKSDLDIKFIGKK
jgi:hypothetical protein